MLFLQNLQRDADKIQKFVSLGFLLLSLFAIGLFCLFDPFSKMQLFAVLTGMTLLAFALAVRYALADGHQISWNYRRSLSGWRVGLFDFVKFVAPALTVLSFGCSVVLQFV